MLAVLSMCLVPFLQLGVHYLAYKLNQPPLAATVADGRVAGLIDGIGGAFGLILGMTGASALLLLVSMVASVSLAGAVMIELLRQWLTGVTCAAMIAAPGRQPDPGGGRSNGIGRMAGGPPPAHRPWSSRCLEVDFKRPGLGQRPR